MKFYLQKEAENKDPMNELGKIIDLSSEKPSITIIDNLSSLNTYNPDFIKNAKIGYKIFRFKNGAILYDPTSKKIVNAFSGGALFKEEIKPLKVALRYNGSDTEKQRVMLFKQNLVQALPQITFTEITQSQATYPGDVLYLVNKSRKDDVMRLDENIGGGQVLENLEPLESPTDADVIIAFTEHKIVDTNIDINQ